LSNQNKTITVDDCREYLSENIFRFRAKNYSTKYPIWPGEVGLEIEAFPFTGVDSNKLTKLKPENGAWDKSFSNIEDLTTALCQLGVEKNWSPKVDSYLNHENKQKEVVPLITLEDKDNLSFEPGGQLEHSTIPYPCLSDAARRVRKIQSTLDKKLEESLGSKLRHIGINPYHSPDEIGLQMDKKRYIAMNEYFSSIGPWGKRMMRQTCTIQVCLDFGPDEETMAKRFFLADFMSPLIQAIFAYSPFMDGKLADIDGVRSKTWFEIDRSRTGINSSVLKELSESAETFSFTKNKCVETYLDFLMKSNVVFVSEADYQVPSNHVIFSDWLNNDLLGHKPSQADLETQLSLLFPEVRPKGFLELRSPDAQDRAWQFVPAALYTGVLYDNESMDKAFELLIPYGNQVEDLLVKASLGLKDELLASLSKKLINIAIEGFSKLPPCFSEEGTAKSLSAFAETFTERAETPASIMRQKILEAGKDTLDETVWKKLREDWLELSK
jgi:glutamate--cysteine ligase